MRKTPISELERTGKTQSAVSVLHSVVGRELLRELEELQDALTDAARRSAP